MYQVKLTDTAIQCLFDIEAFKTITLKSAKATAEFTDSLLKRSIDRIRRNPKQYKYNTILANYGLSVRERIDEDDYRILFEVNEKTKIIYILLILHTRQDLLKALYRHQTIYIDPV
ncbi:type II toxin-antitoxin system RelE/ParE family toxin [Commensalibacter nepenthis]|uniref:Type II toxin-antitoxin system RelE/ParE family toxin n=1 Tax=Commensalibacter nepenthis TaxID=3043872 RepID=A0ABT6Q4T8_9PROT|nr:type II toxin-antitoxin system RelE/ParE family toxin [Commensalibacter sp. TBRC 10068]MDI2111757.1 type II toxin-antitoxin system RelE/ParE family toxin [Commensalibacter sp. TBRC 10068]